jgi:hypothetical protein
MLGKKSGNNFCPIFWALWKTPDDGIFLDRLGIGMLTENFGQIIEVEKRIIFCPKSQATWKDFQKSSRVAKSLRQFAKDLRNCFQGARKFWADRESLVKLPKRFADISHHSWCSLT